MMARRPTRRSAVRAPAYVQAVRRRDVPVIASVPLPSRRVSFPTAARLDGRRWNPDRFRRPMALLRAAMRIVDRSNIRIPGARSLVRYAEPALVDVCRRREERRSVIFASGVGGSRMRKRDPKRNAMSGVSCRRG